MADEVFQADHETWNAAAPLQSLYNIQAGLSEINIIRFGVFEVDLRAGELRKRDVKVKLQEQPLQALQVLLGRWMSMWIEFWLEMPPMVGIDPTWAKTFPMPPGIGYGFLLDNTLGRDFG